MSESSLKPEAEYQRRAEARRRATQDRLKIEARLANLRLGIFLTGVALVWSSFVSGVVHWGWIFLPAAGFVLAVARHDRVRRERVRSERAVDYYERGLRRLADQWVGEGPDGAAFQDPAHPYSADLDLFGRGSLFQLICSARTTTGERVLADWLRHPAPPDEIARRQQAIRELRDKLDLRESLAVMGQEVGRSIDPEHLITWAASPPRLTGRWPVFAAALLAISNIAALTGWLLYGSREPLTVSIAATLALAWVFRTRVREVLAQVRRAERELESLAAILGLLEQQSFDSPLLVQLHKAFEAQGRPPSRQIAWLAKLVQTDESRGNMMFMPLAGLLMLGTQLGYALERWREISGKAVPAWFAAVGAIEALAALAGLAYEHPDDPFPEIIEDSRPIFEGLALGHPLIGDSRSVRNDVRLGPEHQLLLISGSNMSGKSTLLRTVGANTVLALAGATVRARELRVSPVAVGACMRIQDSLQEGLSHFYAEIVRLRQIVELGTSSGTPVIFLLDEILHGTNSHDRRVGAEALIRGLLDRGAIGLVTTHDLALAQIADDLAPRATNVHFEDHLEGDRILFDYSLKDGVVQRSNALELMRAVGLDV